MPATRDLIEEVTLDTLAWRRGDPQQVAQDPRFAVAIYRAPAMIAEAPTITDPSALTPNAEEPLPPKAPRSLATPAASQRTA